MTGPQHLREAARLAHLAVHNDDPHPYTDVELDRMAVAAQAHALAAQAHVFAAVVAADETAPEFAAPWLDLLDPAGTARAAMAARAEQRRADLEARYAPIPLVDNRPPADER